MSFEKQTTHSFSDVTNLFVGGGSELSHRLCITIHRGFLQITRQRGILSLNL